MSEPIEDPSALPGTDVHDQLGGKVGPVEKLYAPGGDGDPMWVTVDMSAGLFKSRVVFVPLARLKYERGTVQVPYSKQFLEDAPDVEASDELSKEDEQQLRDYYGLYRGDGELRTDNEDSYAAQAPDPDEAGEPSRPIS